MQPRHEATLTQPLQCDLQRLNCKHTIELRAAASENCSSKTGWISTPKQEKDDFEALFERIFKRKITSAKIEKIYWQIAITAWMQPLQYDLRCLGAKDNSNHGTKQPWRSHYNAICCKNTTAPKPDLDAKAEKKTISKHFLKQFLKGKLLAPKLGKFADKSLSQPGCSHSNTIYDVQLQKRQYSITHAAAARSNLDASHYNAICSDWVAKTQ